MRMAIRVRLASDSYCTYLQLLQAMPQIQAEKLLCPFLELLLQHAKTSNLLALL